MTRELAKIERPDPSFPVYFAHRVVDDHYLVTNQAGEHAFLAPADFKSYVEGSLSADSDTYRMLAERSFIASEANVDVMAQRLRKRQEFLRHSRWLNSIAVTHRSDQTCAYERRGQASMDASGEDMSEETVERCIDLVMKGPATAPTLLFTGGEPLANFTVVRHAIEYAKERNESVGKELGFAILSDLGPMDDEQLSYLVRERVRLVTRIDGPKGVHDELRGASSGSPFAGVERWVPRWNEARAELGGAEDEGGVDVLCTVTRASLGHAGEIVQTCADLGVRALAFQPLLPALAPGLACTAAEFLDLYGEALDRVIDVADAGGALVDRFAAVFLTKILVGEDPGFVGIRTPGGSAIGELSFDCDGRIFTSEEGRRIHLAGDDFFLLGSAGEATQADLIHHPTVDALIAATTLLGTPDCVNCTYHHYCGTLAEQNYLAQGSLRGRMRDSFRCAVHKGIQDLLFTKLRRGAPKEKRVFERWATVPAPRGRHLV